MLGSIHEAVHQVVRDVQLVTLALVDVIMEVPEGPARPIKVFIKGVYRHSFFVFVIYEERFKAK